MATRGDDAGDRGRKHLAETVFFVAQGEGYLLRWFTPTVEVELCGHATLASGYVVTNILAPERRSVKFETVTAGPLGVTRDGDLLAMDFSAWPPETEAADPRIALSRSTTAPRMSPRYDPISPQCVGYRAQMQSRRRPDAMGSTSSPLFRPKPWHR